MAPLLGAVSASPVSSAELEVDSNVHGRPLAPSSVVRLQEASDGDQSSGFRLSSLDLFGLRSCYSLGIRFGRREVLLTKMFSSSVCRAIEAPLSMEKKSFRRVQRGLRVPPMFIQRTLSGLQDVPPG
jgi:hypothetical protein